MVLLLCGLLGVGTLVPREVEAPTQPPPPAETVSPGAAPVLIGGHESSPASAPTGPVAPRKIASSAAIEEPPDPLQKGTCSVHVTLVDKNTGRLARSDVQLWRLNAPGNTHWKRGDQYQKTEHVHVTGKAFQNLAAGTYRLHVQGQARGTEDSLAFEVDENPRRLTFRVPMPQRFPGRLTVFDERGRLLTHGRWTGGDCPVVNRETSPAWRKPRMRRDPSTVVEEDDLMECQEIFGAIDEIDEPTDAASDGFALDPICQSSRVKAVETEEWFEFDGRSTVHVTASHQVDREHVYWAVSVPVAPIHDSVRMPDGTRAFDHGPGFYMTCRASLAPPFQVFDARDHVVDVHVSLAGYDELDFQVRPGEAIPERVLRRRKE